jgi:hypothetical protein
MLSFDEHPAALTMDGVRCLGKDTHMACCHSISCAGLIKQALARPVNAGS